jgi:hypothetical protein
MTENNTEYQLYDSWSIKESAAVGQIFIGRCKANYSYESLLTKGKEYEIQIIPGIMPLSPLCKGTGDNGKGFQCHLTRFEKLREL